MPVYTFPFNGNAAGRAVTVLTEDGTVVNSGTVTGTPDETGAYVYSATLDEGAYSAIVTSESGRTLFSQGKFDIPDSIAAGGVAAVHGYDYELEYNGGTAECADGASLVIPFDTVSEGISELGNDTFGVPAGLYIAYYDIEPNQPTEDRWAQLIISGGTTPQINHFLYPIALSASAPNFYGFNIAGQCLLPGGNVMVTLTAGSEAGNGDPLVIDYALVRLVKIA